MHATTSREIPSAHQQHDPSYGTRLRVAHSPGTILGRGARLILLPVFLAVLGALLCFAAGAHAADITPNSTLDNAIAGNGLCTLREAVNNANADADTTGGDCAAGTGADTIHLGSATYSLNPGVLPVEDNNVSDDLDIPATGGDLTIVGQGGGSIINGTGSVANGNRVLHINPPGGVCDITVDIVDLTIRNGHTGQGGGGIRNDNCTVNIVRSLITENGATFGAGASDNGKGGGIHNSSGTLNIIDSFVWVNQAKASVGMKVYGGGIYNDGGTVNISGSYIYGNRVATLSIANAAADGGGIYNHGGVVTISGSMLSLNEATGGVAAVIGNGGGIYNAGMLSIRDSVLTDNSADIIGGGIYNDIAATVDIYESMLFDNEAGTDGGGIYHDGTMLEIGRSTVWDNEVGYFGGGIFSAGPANITNSTFSGNRAGWSGGGIMNVGGPLTIHNATFTANRADDDGDGVGDGGGIFRSGGTVSLKNTIVAENTDLTPVPGDIHPDLSGNFTSLGYNLIGDGTGGSGLTNMINADQVGASGSPIDPLLHPLGDYGGPTLTHALQAGSPAVNSGTCLGAPAFDQRGRRRPDMYSTSCDIGAYELGGGIPIFLPVVVTNP